MKQVQYWVLAAFLLAVDQISKLATETHLPMQEVWNLVSVLSLYRTYNTGIAFSMLNWAGVPGLIALAVIVLVVMLYLWSKVAPEKWLVHIGFAAIVAGAIGNLIDRAWHGHVIDMILLHTQNWSFAVFNLADAFITVGACAIVLDEILSYRTSKRTS